MLPASPDHRLGFSHIPTQDKFVVEIDGAQYEMTFDQGGSRVELNRDQWLALAAKSQAFFNSFDKGMSPVSKNMWIDFNSRHEVVQLSSQAEGDSEATPTPAKNLHLLTPAAERDTSAAEAFSPRLDSAMKGLSQSVTDITSVRYPFAAFPECSLCHHAPDWREGPSRDSLRDRSLSHVEGTIDGRGLSAPPSLTRSRSAPATATHSLEMPPARSLPVDSRLSAPHSALPTTSLAADPRLVPAHTLPGSVPLTNPLSDTRLDTAAHSLPAHSLPAHHSTPAHTLPESAPLSLTRQPSSVAIDMPPLTPRAANIAHPVAKPNIASIVADAQWSAPHATIYGALGSATGMSDKTLQDRLAYRLLHDDTDKDEFFLKPENFQSVFDALKHARDAASADRSTRGTGWARWTREKEAVIKTFKREEREDVENALSLNTLPEDPKNRKLLLRFLSAYIKQGNNLEPGDVCDLFSKAFKLPIVLYNGREAQLIGAPSEEAVDPMKCLYLASDGTQFFVKKDQVQAIKPAAVDDREDDDKPVATLRFTSLPKGKGLGSRFETAMDSEPVPLLPASSPKSKKKKIGARFIDEDYESRV